ncbi:MAG TPA: GNAT family N-acetyltransferase [Rhizomicrobium sp.]|nr:GNAT family N-acetyltransferase [Rhizomicrobium sp.]
MIEYGALTGDQHGKHRLDRMPARLAKHLMMFCPSEPVVADLMAKARLSIPGIAETAEVLKVLRHNPDYMFALTRKSKFNPDAPTGEGFIAILPLNRLGLQHLALGTIDAGKPDIRLLAKAGERPAGVYLWAVYAPGPLVAGMALFMEKMSAPQYTGVDIYSRPNTEAGMRFNHGMGFVRGTKIGDIEAPNVWTFSRKEESPLYDTYIPGAVKHEIGITVARTFDDLMRVAAIRNSVYIGEQECPFAEEYDGNDLSATHLLAYIGDEPVGCLRLRFFADFAKFERMAIRKEYRKSRAAIQLARAGFKFCQKKGYRRAYGHIQERLVPFWSRFGFRVKENSRKILFSDYEYIEIVADIEPDPHAINISSDPYIIIRPEGTWHRTGILELSALRSAPHHQAGKKN